MLKRFGLEAWLTCGVAVIVAAFWIWNTQLLGGGRLSADDVEAYAASIEANLDLPAEDKAALVERVRRWASNDDGRPVYMVNIMRYHDEVRPYPALDPAHISSPQASNLHYENSVLPLAIARASYPIYAGDATDASVTPAPPGADGWSRIIVMRYPNRRAFLELVSSPAYGRVAAHKLMALEIALVPTAAQIAPFDYTVLAAGLGLIIVLAVGWMRAARRRAA